MIFINKENNKKEYKRQWYLKNKQRLKEKAKLYNQRPDIKEKRKNRQQTPEHKEYMKNYEQKTENKEKAKLRKQSLKYKEKTRLRNQLPHIKERARIRKQKPNAKEYDKRYYLEHKKEISDKNRIYREKNKEKISNRNKIKYQKNKENILEKHRNNYKNNSKKFRERSINNYWKNPKKSREIRKTYRLGHLDEAREYNKKYRQEFSDKIKKDKSNYNRTAFLECVSHYSHGTNRCSWDDCDEDRLDTYTIDHIDGGGRKHKREKNIGNIYHWLRKNNFPEGYQIICANHQMEKVIINNEFKTIKNPTQERQKRRIQEEKRYDKLRWETFSIYSNSSIPYCKVCGRTYLWHLCLDHVNDDGAEDRKKYVSGGGINFYRKLRKEGYPNRDKYQVLCYDCNLIKERERRKS